MARITVAETDDLSVRLRELLDLADRPSDVFYVPGTRDIEVPDELADRFVEAQASAPRKRAPRTKKTEE